MPIQDILLDLITPQNQHGSDDDDLIIGSLFDDTIDAKAGDDVVFGLLGDDEINGGDGEDEVNGGFGDDALNGGNDVDQLFGGFGDDTIAGNRGDDLMFGGFGDDMLVWNNGDGSDLMVGGQGDDRVQVNFNTDLVNDDLQNKDVAEFSVTDEGVQFARVEVNDQAVNGLFQLDIRQTETLETNFGGGDDTARLIDTILDEIALDLDGGDGVDLLDLSQVAGPVVVQLAKGAVGSAIAENFENVIGTEFDDRIIGDGADNVISGLGGVDRIFGRDGDDILVANKGDDFVFGGAGDDKLVWNNGDGSDLMFGGRGYDLVQVNFDTDLVNDDLQNKDVAEFSVTDEGVQFARIELNDQAVNGLFQLDIRKTEALETNFGGGDDAAVIVDNVLHEIVLDLDGGAGVDLLDFSQADGPVDVDLAAGTIGTSTAVNFENVTGTDANDVIRGDDQDNVIRGGAGNDVMSGGAGADTFVFFEDDIGVDVILDFEVNVDRLQFVTTDPGVTAGTLVDALSQAGDDVELSVNGKLITIEDAQVGDFGADAFLIA
ncbi:MAG: calcium-binding protein [Pseudomonadota bacterium]